MGKRRIRVVVLFLRLQFIPCSLIFLFFSPLFAPFRPFSTPFVPYFLLVFPSFLHPLISFSPQPFLASHSSYYKMGSGSKSLYISLCGTVGWVVLALTVLGACNGVVIKADTILTTETTNATPTLHNLLTCPTLSTTGSGPNKGIFETANKFVLVDCSDGNGAMISVSDCNTALNRAAIFVGTGTSPVLPPIPLLPFSVASNNTAYSYGFYATYAGRINFRYATGVAFSVSTVSSIDENGAALESVVQGVRGLVTLSGESTELLIGIFANDSTPNTNPCSASGDMSDVNVTGEFDSSPQTTPYLFVNASGITNSTPLCHVAGTTAYGTTAVPTSFSSGNTSSCSELYFGTERFPRFLLSLYPFWPCDRDW